MTAFAVMAALLVAAVLAALLPPLLRRSRRPGGESARDGNVRILREQLAELDAEHDAGAISDQQWSASREEIERRALEEEGLPEVASASGSPLAATAIAILLPLLAALIYASLGTPAALSPMAPAATETVTPAQINAMVERLAERMQANPDDTRGWVMLGRSYAVLERYREAATAYGKAVGQRPGDAQLLADYADALGMANGRNLSGEPEALIRKALAADGDNVKALALAGTAAFEKRVYPEAIRHWEKAVGLMSEDSAMRQAMQSGIAEARAKLGDKADAAPPVAGETPAPAGAFLTGTVRLSPALAPLVNPDDIVYIFARAAEGPRMPLAVLRKKVRDLPLSFSLDDSMAMTPAMKLSGFPRVVVVARISRSGLASPDKDDPQAESGAISSSSQGVTLEISAAAQ